MYSATKTMSGQKESLASRFGANALKAPSVSSHPWEWVMSAKFLNLEIRHHGTTLLIHSTVALNDES